MKTPAIRRILVPTDFTQPSKAALEWAMTLGRKFDAAIRVFHAGVVPPVSYADVVTWPVGPIEDAARNAMQSLITNAATSYPGIEGGVRIGVGAADEILKEAEDWKADLVVMSTHGRKGITRLLMGSVAENVLRHSPTPVLVVRPTEE